jgi:hypothetical protein
MSNFSPEQFQIAHRAVIQCFQKARPAAGWTRRGTGNGDRSAHYIVHEVAHHISSAWELGSANIGHGASHTTSGIDAVIPDMGAADPMKDPTLVSYIDDFVLDSISKAAGTVIFPPYQPTPLSNPCDGAAAGTVHFFRQHLHSRMPLVPTSACLQRAGV